MMNRKKEHCEIFIDTIFTSIIYLVEKEKYLENNSLSPLDLQLKSFPEHEREVITEQNKFFMDLTFYYRLIKEDLPLKNNELLAEKDLTKRLLLSRNLLIKKKEICSWAIQNMEQFFI